MPLLRTRTFELAVHSLDIASVADIAFSLPVNVLAEAAALSARVVALNGMGDGLAGADWTCSTRRQILDRLR